MFKTLSKIRLLLSLLLFLSNSLSNPIGSAGGLYTALCIVIKITDGIVITGLIVGLIYISIQIIWPAKQQGSLSDYVPFIAVLLIASQAKNIITFFVADNTMDDFIEACSSKSFGDLISTPT